MTESFQELSVAEELVAVLADLGYQRATAVQRAAIPVLRRGTNVLLHAASGAGGTVAYGVALVERLRAAADRDTLQALVITPSDQRAAATALALGQLGRALGVTVGVPGAGWQANTCVAVVPIQRVLAQLQASQLKLDEIQTLVLHDVSALLSLDSSAALDTLLSAVPREAQRVLLTSSLTPEVEKLAEAHARRALHVPARPALRETTRAEPGTTIEYYVLSGAEARQMLAEAVTRQTLPAVVFCRTPADSADMQQELSVRGLPVHTRLYGDPIRAGEAALGWGAPPDAESLTRAFEQGGTIVLEPAQLAHVKNVAKQAHLSLRGAAVRAARDTSSLDSFRESIRRALREEDIDAQLLVLEPLLDEHSAAEIAAAATALLRKRAPPPAEKGMPAPPMAAPPPALVKLFLSVGQRDAIAAREVVGTITGEANVSGDQIGRVEIRDTFTIVEVAAEVAERVIRALNGTSLRGRSLRVDYDRKPSVAKRSLPARRTHPRS